MNAESLTQRTLPAVLALLYFGILTSWVREFWAVAAFQAGIFGLGLVWSVALLTRHPSVRLSPLLVPLGAATAWPLLQLATKHTVYRWETWTSFWNWAGNWVVFFLALQLGCDPARLIRYLKALMYFGGIVATASALQMFTARGKIFWLFPSGYDDFVLGPFVYQNQFAAFIELILPIALYFSLVNKGNRLLAASIAAAMVASVLASASRTGTVLVTAELLLVPVLTIRTGIVSRRAGGVGLAKIAAFAGLGALVVGNEVVWKRFLLADPYVIRREVWIAALNMVADRSVFGFGLGTWATAYPQYAVFDPGLIINQAHNDWLQWTVEGGIPFLLLMLVAALLLARPSLRSIWGLGVMVVLAHALVDYPFQQRPALAALFFALAGAVAGMDHRDRVPSIPVKSVIDRV
jgi:O-antigen ligase